MSRCFGREPSHIAAICSVRHGLSCSLLPVPPNTATSLSTTLFFGSAASKLHKAMSLVAVVNTPSWDGLGRALCSIVNNRGCTRTFVAFVFESNVTTRPHFRTFVWSEVKRRIETSLRSYCCALCSMLLLPLRNSATDFPCRDFPSCLLRFCAGTVETPRFRPARASRCCIVPRCDLRRQYQTG